MATSALDLYKVYEFLKRLAMPFEKWPAYKEGIIDKEGNILIPKKDRNTMDQKNAFQIFDLMILKLKKLFFVFENRSGAGEAVRSGGSQKRKDNVLGVCNVIF